MYQPPRIQVIGEMLWSRLRALTPPRVRPARSVLLRQGDPATHVILLDSGSALVTLTGASGGQTLLAVRGAGELLGELAVLDDRPRTATVIAAEACHVHIVPAPEFLKFVNTHELLTPLLRHAISRVRESDAVRFELATASVPVRLASALYRLVEASSTMSAQHSVPLTQAELSQLIGASRNAVGSALRPWREEGWVRTAAGGGLLVCNIHAIQSHAQMQT
ncbi:Crp/Fnr family transcriptional regulator [Streptomyces fagopyri]|uniref:Crp/Fnr family transcriptional regulator n=1 Tax=Streptomyces fagopyri TaxID=2662397 RepID=UPI0036CFFDCC